MVAEALSRWIDEEDIPSSSSSYYADNKVEGTAALPSALDPLYSTGGCAMLISESSIAFSSGGIPTPLNRSRKDRDPISGALGFDWWLLGRGDVVTVEFEGTGIALLTHLGISRYIDVIFNYLISLL